MFEQSPSSEQPDFFEAKISLSRAAHDRLSVMAIQRGIELDGLLRRALGTFDAFDRLQQLHPEGHAEYVWLKSGSEAGIEEVRFEMDIPIK
jgi:hypothetical protein